MRASGNDVAFVAITVVLFIAIGLLSYLMDVLAQVGAGMGMAEGPLNLMASITTCLITILGLSGASLAIIGMVNPIIKVLRGARRSFEGDDLGLE